MSSTADLVTIRYVVPQVTAGSEDKPRKLRVKQMCLLKPNLEAHICVKTAYSEPFVLTGIMSDDTKAAVVVRDICKGIVTIVVSGSKCCNATVFIEVSEGESAILSSASP